MEQNIDFNKSADGLIPAIIQHAANGNVLMLGYMNAEALALTASTKTVTFFSRSRAKLWTKGETSGNFLRVVEIRADCDGDAILIRAEPHGPVCHTGKSRCFDTADGPLAADIISEIESVIRQRQLDPNADSYTSSMFRSGINRIAQKVGEEAIEVVIEAKNDDNDRLRSEVADLVFHLLVLLRARGLNWQDVLETLAERRPASAGRVACADLSQTAGQSKNT